jgi:hypothetical protein
MLDVDLVCYPREWRAVGSSSSGKRGAIFRFAIDTFLSAENPLFFGCSVVPRVPSELCFMGRLRLGWHRDPSPGSELVAADEYPLPKRLLHPAGLRGKLDSVR